MKVLEKERVDTQESPAEPEGTPRRRHRIVPMMATLAVVAVAAVAVYSGLSGDEEPSRPTAEPVTETAVVTAPVDRDTLMIRWANQGLIPRQAVDWERIKLERLVNQGLIPRQALEPQREPVVSLYTPQEQAILDAVARGDLPEETLDSEPFRTKRLINLGLIPRQAAES